MFSLYLALALWFVLWLYPDPYVANYSFFEQWTEAEMEDINFFIVAPHWYFRPHMGLLTVCAQHYEGLFWLVSFYVLLNLMPHLYRFFNGNKEAHGVLVEGTSLRYSPIQQALFVVFLMSIIYVDGTLPCGRFYYEGVEGFFGNSVLKLSYQYLYLYMGFLAHVGDRLERWLAGVPTQQERLSSIKAASERRRLPKPRTIDFLYDGAPAVSDTAQAAAKETPARR